MNGIRRLFLHPSQQWSFINKNMLTRSQIAAFSSSNLQVNHDTNKEIFYVGLNSEKALLEYSRNENVLDLYHTYVPDIFRGKGVAQILTQAAFDYIEANNLKMIVTCSYVKKFLDKNDKYKKLLA